MTLAELKHKIDSVLNTYPEAASSVVLVDTEARKFPAHMIDVDNVWFDTEANSAIGYAFTAITIDLRGATD